MFRFLIFIFGIIAGFTAALLVLPLPGKTFFNRMSRLPPSAKDLIDNSINLGISFFRVAFNASKEFNHRFNIVLDKTRTKIDELNDKYSKEFAEMKAKKNGKARVKNEKKEELGV